MRRQSMLLVEPRQLEWVIEDLPPFVGSSDGWDYQEHARWYFDVVRGHSYNLEQIFNYHTIPLSGLPVVASVCGIMKRKPMPSRMRCVWHVA
jgi:hypothetical protein